MTTVHDELTARLTAGVPACRIDDVRLGATHFGEPGGSILCTVERLVQQLTAARLQRDLMSTPSFTLVRTHAAVTGLLEDREDVRDQAFLLGATNLELPSFRTASLAMLRRLELARTKPNSARESGDGDPDVRGSRNNLALELRGPTAARRAPSESEFDLADRWLDSSGVADAITRTSCARDIDDASGQAFEAFMERWRSEARLKTFGEAVAELMCWPPAEGHHLPRPPAEWLELSRSMSLEEMHERADVMGIYPTWDCEHAKTLAGDYPVRAGVEYAIARARVAAPHADVISLVLDAPDLRAAAEFARVIRAELPHKLLAYSLLPGAVGSSVEAQRFETLMRELSFVLEARPDREHATVHLPPGDQDAAAAVSGGQR